MHASSIGTGSTTGPRAITRTAGPPWRPASRSGYCCSITFAVCLTRGASSGSTPRVLQFFVGGAFFQHAFSHERSHVSHWHASTDWSCSFREPAIGTRSRRVAQPGPQAGRDHGLAQGHHLSKQRQAAACGDVRGSTAWRDGTASDRESYSRVAKAAEKMVSRYAHAQTVQAASKAVAHPALPSGPDYP